ncbi:MAG: regulatory protein RecX, partial [Candidatus Izemoplasmatales bacterium]|nr:regulatory protein RecX [Candidatus Izemoplasmatales bacterium]
NKSFYLGKLKKIKIINDNLYTENYISDSINLKHIGPRKIYEDLKFKGISQELITEKIIVYNKKEMLENIEYWLDKKIKMSSNIPMMKLKNQLKSFLVNKGFNFDDISSIISKKEDDISSSVNEDKIIIKEIENLKTKYNKKGLKMSLNQFLTSKLLAKGYQYSTIKKFL